MYQSHDVELLSTVTRQLHDISANPSWSPLSSSLSLPSPPTLFSRPSNISENPEWSPLWLTTPPLRKMCSLPTYQMPVAIILSDFLIAAQPVNQPEGTFVAALQSVNKSESKAIDMSLVPVSRRAPSTAQESDTSFILTLDAQIILMSRPTSLSRKLKNDISENPSWSPLSCPVPLSRTFITFTLNVCPTLTSPQKSVLFYHYRHECPIAIVRPVLMLPIKSMGNSQGKCGRYKIRLRLYAHWSDVFMALSHVMKNRMRRRIAVAPNDNSEI